MRPVLRGGLIAAVMLAAACAARAPARTSPVDLDTADEAVHAGCYTCLREARDRYDRALAHADPQPRAVVGAFETSLLLALREKELGLGSGPSIARARELAGRQPDPALAATLVELAEEVRGEGAGIDPEERAERTRLRRVPPARLDISLLPPDGLPFSSIATAYLWLTLECEHPVARRSLEPETVRIRAGDSSLVRFRLGLCHGGPVEVFTALRDGDGRWTEISFFEGRLLTSDPQTLTPGVAALRVAHEALPASPAVTMTLADAERTLRDMDAALAHYDEVLSGAPTHRDALLGRTYALTQLERHEEGIAGATRLIDLGTWYLGDAYYLRAWNEYQLKDLDAAWRDIERATQLRSSTDVFTLAGLVAYARKDLDTARERFSRAWTLDRTNCSAEQYLGIVKAEQRAWAEAAPVFSTAMGCFTAAAAKARTELAQVEAADTAPDFKARQAAEHQKIIEDSDLQAARCAYNAAQGFARVGRRDEARQHLGTALEHPELKPQAETLRRLIDPR